MAAAVGAARAVGGGGGQAALNQGARVDLGSPDVEVEVAPLGVAALVAIERQDLDEILGNLVENAAKYGGGSVFVTVDPDPDSELASVWIEDDGLGISLDDRAKLFSRGARLDTTGKPGTGLGLAISRKIAAELGGSLDVGRDPRLGGASFRLRLPTERRKNQS